MKIGTERCGNCKYWDKKSHDVGGCRRRPPTVLNFNGQIVSTFPSTGPKHWCGDWRTKIEIGAH